MSRIDNWLDGVKKYLFLYRDGYFEVPFLSNSPEIMVATLKRMPFAKHNENEKSIHTSGIFTAAAIRYRELEEGFWVIVSEIEFKKNICIKPVYDKGPCDHYFLGHYNLVNILPGNTAPPVVGWSLYKPGAAIKRYFSKGDKGVFINFAFNTAWFARNIPLRDIADELIIQNFSAETDTFSWTNIAPGAEALTGKMLALIKQENQMQFNNLALKMLCLDIISKFFVGIYTGKAKNHAKILTEADGLMMEKAEKLLLTALTEEFPGIEAIAAELNTSRTKLITSFKATHNTSLYQYYRQKQMDMALEILRAKPTSLKEIALTFGYDNPSKFSAAFKKYHKFSPTQV